MKKILGDVALSKNCTTAIFRISRTTKLPVLLDSVADAKRAEHVYFDSTQMLEWPRLIDTIQSKLNFNNTTNRGYDFGLDALLDCMRDVIDDSPNGMILIFRNADKILERDRTHDFWRFYSVLGGIADYASQTINDGEWWDRDPRYFKVVLETSDRLPVPEILF